MSSYAPCPRCRNSAAEKVKFTWWGGLLGPKLLTHVKCASCGHKYNGKSGKDNTSGIAIYFGVMFLLAFVVFFVAAFALVMSQHK